MWKSNQKMNFRDRGMPVLRYGSYDACSLQRACGNAFWSLPSMSAGIDCIGSSVVGSSARSGIVGRMMQGDVEPLFSSPPTNVVHMHIAVPLFQQC
jgi:hypothetical protein